MRTPNQIKRYRWVWMMDWCKSKELSPALDANWTAAAMAWIQHEEDEANAII